MDSERIPVKISNLDVEGFVHKLAEMGIKSSKGKIKELHGKQKEIVQAQERFIVIPAGRRSGKTYLAAMIICTAMTYLNDRVVWVVAKDYKTTERVFKEVYRILIDQLYPKILSPEELKQIRKSRRDHYILTPWGCELQGKSLENPSSLVGEGVDLLIWDEAAAIDSGDSFWDQELRATLADTQGSAMFISSPRGQNYFWKFYLRGILKDEKWNDWASFKFTSYENPTNKKSELDRIRLQTSPEKFAQEYLADFEAVSDRTFPEFNKNKHIVDYEFDPANGPVFAAMDFNYVVPCTTLYCQVTDEGDIIVFDQFFKSKCTIHEQANQYIDYITTLTEKYPTAEIGEVIADFAGDQNRGDGRTHWDDLADWGIHPQGKKQRIAPGIDKIRLWLAFPSFKDHKGEIVPKMIRDENGELIQERHSKIFIASKCDDVIFSLASAENALNKQTRVFKEEYKKDGVVDGPLDCLRYLLVYLFDDSNVYEQTYIEYL